MDGHWVWTQLLCGRRLKALDLELLDEVKLVDVKVGFLL
jgi:hypothetical protein